MRSSKEQIPTKKETAFDIEKSSRSLRKQIDDTKEEIDVLLEAEILAMENPNNINIVTDSVTGQKTVMIKKNGKVIYLTSNPEKIKDLELLKEGKAVKKLL